MNIIIIYDVGERNNVVTNRLTQECNQLCVCGALSSDVTAQAALDLDPDQGETAQPDVRIHMRRADAPNGSSTDAAE